MGEPVPGNPPADDVTPPTPLQAAVTNVLNRVAHANDAHEIEQLGHAYWYLTAGGA
jgi:hypothetical protein